MSGEAYLREVTYDKKANAVYVKVRDTKVHKTHECAIESFGSAVCNVDVDRKGNLIGVEILL